VANGKARNIQTDFEAPHEKDQMLKMTLSKLQCRKINIIQTFNFQWMDE